jgi:hypothetical protein
LSAKMGTPFLLHVRLVFWKRPHIVLDVELQ